MNKNTFTSTNSRGMVSFNQQGVDYKSNFEIKDDDGPPTERSNMFHTINYKYQPQNEIQCPVTGQTFHGSGESPFWCALSK